MDPLIQPTDRGLFCPRGDFYIDPWRPVDRAVITHAHADHARWGMKSYLGSREGEHVLRVRMGAQADITTLPYGASVDHNGVRVSFHPAGHVLGSAQVRLECHGQVCVVTGDYKLHADPTCTPFEPVRCHLFLSETTFGLPIYRWTDPAEVAAQMNAWWRESAAAGACCVLYGYALGKAQRMLAMLDPSIGPIYLHGAVEKVTQAYRDSNVSLPPTKPVSDMPKGTSWVGAMVVAPPSAHGTPWMRKFGTVSTGLASGWMTIRGTRRRKAVDRGFVLSDHVDWPTLMKAIDASGASHVWLTHGYSNVVARHLRERGLDARVLETQFQGEAGDAESEPEDAP